MPQIKACDRDRQLKTPRAGTPRVQIHYTSMFGAARFMRVSTHHNVELGGGWFEVKFLNVVQDVYQGRASLGDRGLRQLGCPSTFVNVSSHGNDWRHRTQLFDDLRLANVARMDDQI